MILKLDIGRANCMSVHKEMPQFMRHRESLWCNRVVCIHRDHLRVPYRGVGIEHQYGCTGCCTSCDAGELNYTLTCN